MLLGSVFCKGTDSKHRCKSQTGEFIDTGEFEQWQVSKQCQTWALEDCAGEYVSYSFFPGTGE